MILRPLERLALAASIVLCAVLVRNGWYVHAPPSASPVHTPAPTPGPLAQRPAWLTREAHGPCVDVYTDRDLDPQEYAGVANRALPKLREWFRPARDAEAPLPRYTLYLCSTPERMLELEQLHGEPSSRVPGRTFAFRGGFYTNSRMALIPPGSPRGTRWLIVHELSHAVFAERVGRWADVFDEGLAEVLPDWLLFSELAAPEQHTASYSMHESRCARAVAEHRLPTIGWLCALDYWGFRDDKLENLGFAASWSLMKLLVESREPGIAGRMQALLDDLARGEKQQAALLRECDVARLSRRWNEELRGWADWEPTWGCWDGGGNDWSTRMDDWGTNLLLARRTRRPGAIEMGFTWRAPEVESTGLGFVVGMQDDKNLAYVELIEDERRVHLCVACDGEWLRERSWPIPREVEFDCQPIALCCEPDGSALLSIGDFVLPLEGFDAGVTNGRFGLIAFRLGTAQPRIATTLTASSPWVKD